MVSISTGPTSAGLPFPSEEPAVTGLPMTLPGKTWGFEMDPGLLAPTASPKSRCWLKHKKLKGEGTLQHGVPPRYVRGGGPPLEEGDRAREGWLTWHTSLSPPSLPPGSIWILLGLIRFDLPQTTG